MISPFKVLNQKSGVALLIAITTVAIIAFIAVELSYDSASEYIIASQEVNRLKSRYAAKAGVEISLLRINIYHQAVANFGQMLGNNKAMLEEIWSAPFIWPPVLPPEACGIDKSALNDIVGQSLMDASFTSNIMSESSKIDLNDLVSPSKALRETTKESLVRLIENRLQEDDEWAKRNRDLNAGEIINNIIDWMDFDRQSLNAGDESNYYNDISDSKLPPNQPFKTLEEIHMVAGMTDELYDFLIPKITIYGLKAIQVNHAKKEVLMGIAGVITDDVADKIIERVKGETGPFKDQKEFLTFLSGLGINTQQIEDKLPPLVFDQESNFRIQSIGTYGRTSSEIVAIAYDFDKVKEKLTESLKNDQKQQQPAGQNPADDPSKQQNPQGQQPQNQNQQQQQPAQKKGRPNIVYWTES